MLKYIQNEEGVGELIKAVQSNSVFGLDTETSGLDARIDLLGLLQIATPDDVFVINSRTLPKRFIKYIIDLLNESNKLVIGHNLKFDLKFLYENYNTIPMNLFDTMIAENIQHAGVSKIYSSLDYLCEKYLARKLNKDLREQFIGYTDNHFTDEMIQYAGSDVQYLARLKELLSEKLIERKQKHVFDLEMQLLPVVTLMEYVGLNLDMEMWTELSESSKANMSVFDKELRNIVAKNFDRLTGRKFSNALECLDFLEISLTDKKKAYRQALETVVTYDEIVSTVANEINFGSPKQNKSIIRKLGVPTKDTNEKTLREYKNHEYVNALLKFREYSKSYTTYGEGFGQHIHSITGKIHCDLNQVGTRTGRFASRNPNMQNIKRESDYRSCFVASPGYRLATTDYSQVELRICGVVSREPLFLDAFNQDIDLHAQTASLIFEKPISDVTKDERSIAKNVNFAILYGSSARGLFKNFGISLSDGDRYLKTFFREHRVLNSFIGAVNNEIINRGYSTTMFGRKRFFTIPNVVSKKDIKDLFQIKRQGFNHIIQGTSADMVKMALIHMFYENPWDFESFRPVLTVHDEIVVEFKDTIVDDDIHKFIGHCMTKAGKYFFRDIVPVEYEINIGRSWSK